MCYSSFAVGDLSLFLIQMFSYLEYFLQYRLVVLSHKKDRETGAIFIIAKMEALTYKSISRVCQAIESCDGPSDGVTTLTHLKLSGRS
jgi:hypothetical protein